MVKPIDEVVHDFNELVNMTAEELDTFLKTEGSETTGWHAGDSTGESVGHESGRKIVDILQRNPNKDPAKYTEEDKEHMRRVVSYCKRHMAQEEHLKDEKSPEELEKTKSTRSLKNWGHDPLKTLKNGSSAPKPASKASGKKPAHAEDQTEEKSAKPSSKAKPPSKKADKPASKSSTKPASKRGEKKAAEEAEVGGKRQAEEELADVEEDNEPVDATAEKAKPAPKKAKTQKPASEGTRKPLSRGVKKG